MTISQDLTDEESNDSSEDKMMITYEDGDSN